MQLERGSHTDSHLIYDKDKRESIWESVVFSLPDLESVGYSLGGGGKDDSWSFTQITDENQFLRGCNYKYKKNIYLKNHKNI